MDVIVALVFLATALVALAYPSDWPDSSAQAPFVFFFFPFALIGLSWLAVGVTELPNKTISHRCGCERLLPAIATLSAAFAFGMLLVSLFPFVFDHFYPNPSSGSLFRVLFNLFLIATIGAIVTLVRSAIPLARGLRIPTGPVALIILVVSGIFALPNLYALYPALGPIDRTTIQKYEKLQITSAYPTFTGNQYAISMTIKNIGTAIATLDPTTVFLNGKPTSAYTADNVKVLFNGKSAALRLQPGNVANGTITLNSGTDFVSGMNVSVMVQTTSYEARALKAMILP